MMELGMIQRNETTKQAGIITELLKNKDSLTRKGEKREFNDYHKVLGHPLEAITCVTAHVEGILLMGKFNTFEDCTLGKVRQSNTSKKKVPRSTYKGERLLFVLVCLQSKIWVVKHQLLVDDDCIDYCWSYFLEEKSDLKCHLIELIKELHSKYYCKVKCIYCDNAGENITLEKACNRTG